MTYLLALILWLSTIQAHAAILFSDSFNRPTDASLGGNWVELTGNNRMGIRDNQLECELSCVAAGGVSTNSTALGTGDYVVGGLDASPAGAYTTGLICRASSDTEIGTVYDDYNVYHETSTGSNDYRIFETTNGTRAQLAASVVITCDGCRVELSCSGSTIAVYQDGVAVTSGSVTDPTLTTGRAGVVDWGTHGAGVKILENFVVGDTVSEVESGIISLSAGGGLSGRNFFRIGN